MKTYIYCLFDETNIPIYIGKTTDKSLSTRLSSHKKRLNKNVTIAEIDCIDTTEWKQCEQFWIEQFRQWGFKLMNINKKGGQGPGVYSEESKIKMRKPRKKGTGSKISKTLKQNNHSQYYTDEVRDKISKGNKGTLKPFTKEHQQNMLIAKRKQAKPLLMFDLENNLIKEWESKGQAAEWIKITKGRKGNLTSQIKDCIFGKQKTAFGYKWKYK
jgi:predicted GIY-YIG superfamily endonuclease